MNPVVITLYSTVGRCAPRNPTGSSGYWCIKLAGKFRAQIVRSQLSTVKRDAMLLKVVWYMQKSYERLDLSGKQSVRTTLTKLVLA